MGKKEKVNLPKQTNAQEYSSLKERLETNVTEIQNVFKKDTDFSIRKFKIGGNHPAVAIFISSLVDKDLINRDVIRPIQESSAVIERNKNESFLHWLLDYVLY